MHKIKYDCYINTKCSLLIDKYNNQTVMLVEFKQNAMVPPLHKHAMSHVRAMDANHKGSLAWARNQHYQ